MILFGIPYDPIIFHKVFLWTLSKDFLKSIKLMNNGMFHSILCSMIFLKVNIWSVHPRPFLKPACSSLSLVSITSSILARMILQKTLLGTDSNVTPLQLSQFCKSLFFGILTIRPFDQSGGMFSFSQMFVKRWWKILLAVFMSALSNSALMESTPAALLFLRDFIAFCIYTMLVGWCLC